MKDLRHFIKLCQEIDELKVVEGADWDLEIGALTFSVAATPNPPALLFDKIKGYPPGFRVLSIPCTTDKRCAIILGVPTQPTRLELVNKVRERVREQYKPVPPVEVKTGPILENVISGDKVDLFKFPVPRWTAGDGGRYIGTGDTVIIRDPAEGWVNVSTHRMQVHDRATCTIFCEPGQHLEMIREKYWKQGKNCPAAVTVGGDPFLVSIGGTKIPWGVPEYDYAGWWRREPVEVIKGPVTGLPIPACSEIALEGEIVPLSVESKLEGPFSEFTGHYMPPGPESVFKVKGIIHRNDPIILGVITYLGPGVMTWTRVPIMAARIWEHLDSIVPGVKGVWIPDEFGMERCLVISLKQQYPGHAKQAAMAALGFYSFDRRLCMVVDEDVDPTNLREVLFALGQRGLVDQIEVIKGNWTSKLDPLLANPELKRTKDMTLPIAIIMACKPFNWLDQFPTPVTIAPELEDRVKSKWRELF